MSLTLKRCMEILELAPGATRRDAKAAYHELAKVWHPDRFPNDPKLRAKGELKLKELNEAYKLIVLHLEKRGSLATEVPQPEPASRERRRTAAGANRKATTVAGIEAVPIQKQARMGCAFIASILLLIGFLAAGVLFNSMRLEARRDPVVQAVIEGDGAGDDVVETSVNGDVEENPGVEPPEAIRESTDGEFPYTHQDALSPEMEARLARLEERAREKAKQDGTTNQVAVISGEEAPMHRNGDIEFRLGRTYERGMGVEKDLGQARKWYYESAMAGHVEGQLQLAYMLFGGSGGRVDRTEAFKWAQVSFKLGHQDAQSLVKTLTATLSEDELKEAEKRARLYLESR